MLADQNVFLNDLLRLPQPVDLRLLYDAMDNSVRGRGRRQVMAELVRRASTRQPLMLVVEDLHWAEGINECLAELTATITECAAVLVMTSRIDGDPIDEAWRGAARGGLADGGPPGLFAGKRRSRWPAARCRRCLAWLWPALSEQRAASLSGAIVACRRGDGGLDPSRLDTKPHPGAVDQLDKADKHALQAAAILGQRFSLDLLRRLLRDPGYTCAGLIKRYLIRPDGDDLLFTHALLWEGVYTSLLQARRRSCTGRWPNGSLWEIRSAPSTSTAPGTLAHRAAISRRRFARLPRTGQAKPWSWSSVGLPSQPT